MTILDSWVSVNNAYELYPSSKLKEQKSQNPGNGGILDGMDSKLFTLQIKELTPRAVK